MRTREMLASGVTFLALAGLATAQTPAAKPKAPAVPVFGIVTREVRLSVAVKDNKGHPVTDLKREDFIVLDGDRAQALTSFWAVAASPEALLPAPALPPNTFANRAADTPKNVTVILFDQVNTHIEDQARAKSALLNHLERRKPANRVALYVLAGSQLRLLHEFADDTQRLIDAVRGMKVGLPSPGLDVERAPDTRFAELDAGSTIEQLYTARRTIDRAKLTALALQMIARHLALVPGRKNLVWISGGFPYSIGYDTFAKDPHDVQVHFERELRETAQVLNDSGLAIYPVSASGVMSPDSFAAAKATVSDVASASTFSNKRLRDQRNVHDAMRVMAASTGGRAFFNTNNIGKAIADASDDARFTYLIGFRPDHDAWDGRFRRVKVEVNRDHVRVRHRDGYYAFPEARPTPRQAEPDL